MRPDLTLGLTQFKFECHAKKREFNKEGATLSVETFHGTSLQKGSDSGYLTHDPQ